MWKIYKVKDNLDNKLKLPYQQRQHKFYDREKYFELDNLEYLFDLEIFNKQSPFNLSVNLENFDYKNICSLVFISEDNKFLAWIDSIELHSFNEETITINLTKEIFSIENNLSKIDDNIIFDVERTNINNFLNNNDLMLENELTVENVNQKTVYNGSNIIDFCITGEKSFDNEDTEYKAEINRTFKLYNIKKSLIGYDYQKTVDNSDYSFTLKFNVNETLSNYNTDNILINKSHHFFYNFISLNSFFFNDSQSIEVKRNYAYWNQKYFTYYYYLVKFSTTTRRYLPFNQTINTFDYNTLIGASVSGCFVSSNLDYLQGFILEDDTENIIPKILIDKSNRCCVLKDGDIIDIDIEKSDNALFYNLNFKFREDLEFVEERNRIFGLYNWRLQHYKPDGWSPNSPYFFNQKSVTSFWYNQDYLQISNNFNVNWLNVYSQYVSFDKKKLYYEYELEYIDYYNSAKDYVTIKYYDFYFKSKLTSFKFNVWNSYFYNRDKLEFYFNELFDINSTQSYIFITSRLNSYLKQSFVYDFSKIIMNDTQKNYLFSNSASVKQSLSFAEQNLNYQKQISKNDYWRINFDRYYGLLGQGLLNSGANAVAGGVQGYATFKNVGGALGAGGAGLMSGLTGYVNDIFSGGWEYKNKLIQNKMSLLSAENTLKEIQNNITDMSNNNTISKGITSIDYNNSFDECWYINYAYPSKKVIEMLAFYHSIFGWKISNKYISKKDIIENMNKDRFNFIKINNFVNSNNNINYSTIEEEIKKGVWIYV